MGDNFGSGSGTDSSINTGDAGTDLFLKLISNPFESQIASISFYAALGWSLIGGALLFCLFCILRPRIEWIYAPRAKHADAKHAPPTTTPGFFGWWPTLKAVPEQDLVEKIGLDAVVFLRFLKMCRNIFLCLTIIGCGVLIPVNLAAPNQKTSSGSISDIYVFIRITPSFIYGNILWAYVILLYVFNAIIYYFLWRNYGTVTKLRRAYFESADYRNSLHSRTLLLTHVPKSARSEDGITQIVQAAKTVDDNPKVSVARNVKELPEMIEEHEETVHKLEGILAKYLSDPNQLPAHRPKCKPSKHDKGRSHGHEVDAIDYLTGRIRELESQIDATRQTVDQRNPHPYGFASYTQIEDAHATAYATRKKGPQGTLIRLAPKPHDLIWRNLPMTRSQRRTRSFWNSFWMIVLTILYIPPNVLTAVFLANLHNLGQVWHGFNQSLLAHPTAWAIAQGIVAPGLQILFYLFLPTLFRRLLIKSGDTTKTQRERHVASKLYGFFVFNNLIIFSIFATAWGLIATLVNAKQQNIWDAIKQAEPATQIVIGLCNISPYWVTWQLYRYLGAAVDIVQAWTLICNLFLRKFTNPTPRQMVELTAPQPFIYADYFNNYLFVTTVGFTFGMIQPLILPITAVYITCDVCFKKYLLQYIFITKVESGGAFWRMAFNRILFGTLLMNGVVALLVGAKGSPSPMLYCMIPLLPIMGGFMWFCKHSFDIPYTYYTTKSFTETEIGVAGAGVPERKQRRGGDRVAVKFGHPALYRKLITPMVHAKSQHLLKEIYRGRLDDEDESPYGNAGSRPTSVFGYSDIYMNEMSPTALGKTSKQSRSNAPFEIVAEADLDFENFKRRSDFRQEFGGDGELYGRPEDQMSRPGTPSSMLSFGASSTLMGDRKGRSRSESPAEFGTRDSSTTRVGCALDSEHTYARGYANLNRGDSPSRNDVHMRDQSPPVRLDGIDIPQPGLGRREIADAGLQAYRDVDTLSTYEQRRLSQGPTSGMLQNASAMGRSDSPGRGRVGRKPLATQAGDRFGSHSPSGDMGRGRQSPGAVSGLGRYTYSDGPGSGLMGTPTAEDEFTSYDYFRRGRR